MDYRLKNLGVKFLQLIVFFFNRILHAWKRENRKYLNTIGMSSAPQVRYYIPSGDFFNLKVDSFKFLLRILDLMNSDGIFIFE